jgi:hypothetical protein
MVVANVPALKFLKEQMLITSLDFQLQVVSL